MTLFEHGDSWPSRPRHPLPAHIRGALVSLPLIAIVAAALTPWAVAPGLAGSAAPRLSAADAPIVRTFEREATMTAHARAVLERTAPVIDTIAQLDKTCARVNVLGCYDPKNDRIYLATSAEIAPGEGDPAVVAAHEMLHAAWQRMSAAQKAVIERELDEAFSRLETQPAFAARWKDYSTLDAATRYSELHSVIGTEFSGIGSDLEGYYSRYFGSRATVVARAEENRAGLPG